MCGPLVHGSSAYLLCLYDSLVELAQIFLTDVNPYVSEG
jgi:hypothetical protein